MRKIIVLIAIATLGACTHHQKQLPDYSTDSTRQIDQYGYSPDNPIRVGDGSVKNGPRNEIIFLSSLRGPNGESIIFKRLGSCCAFETPNGYRGAGLLDKYEVSYEGLTQPKILYINMYDPGEIIPPEGFTLY